MIRLGSVVLVVCLLAVPAFAADYTYVEGSTKSFSVNGGSPIPGYTLTWISSKDGVVGTGPVFSVSKLTVGYHVLTLRAVNTATGAVYNPKVTIDITPKPTTPTPAPTPTPTPAPSLVAPHEEDPVSELLLGCNDTYLIESVYSGMVKAVGSRVKTLIFVASENVAYELMDRFAADGADDSSVEYYVVPIDTVWIRDYGPLPVRQATGRLRMVDLKYYPGRDNDNVFPQRYASFKGHDRYNLSLYWEGGNFMADGRGTVVASDILYSRNTSYSPSTIRAMVGDAFGATSLLIQRPMYNEGTGHIDMFTRFMGPTGAVCATFPSGYSNKALLDENAARLSGAGYTVKRIPMADTGISTHVNTLPVNGVMLVPTYARSTDSTALSLFKSYGWETVGIDCRHLIQYSGAVHCVTITIPR